MRDIGADEFVRRIRDQFPKTNVSLEHTGGGCATLYVRDGDTAIAIGPGVMFPSPVFSFEELFVGPEDEELNEASIEVTSWFGLMSAIETWMKIIPQVKQILHPECGDRLGPLRCTVAKDRAHFLHKDDMRYERSVFWGRKLIDPLSKKS